jgi:hypothetical protein
MRREFVDCKENGRKYCESLGENGLTGSGYSTWKEWTYTEYPSRHYSINQKEGETGHQGKRWKDQLDLQPTQFTV